MKERQSQSDLVHLCQQLIRDNNINIVYRHVYGHMDDILNWDKLTLPERLNIVVDKIAEEALLAAMINKRFVKPFYPFEDIVLIKKGEKSTGSPTKDISRWKSREVARAFYSQNKMGARIQVEDFDLVYWKGMGHAMRRFPRRYRRWVTKQLSGSCGCNSYLSRWGDKVKKECPSCGAQEETVAHVTMCRGPGRENAYMSSIKTVSKWLKKNKTEPRMMSIIVRYLYARNTATMTSFTRPRTSPRLAYLANLQDRLGFQNFVEGKICKFMVEIQRIHLEASGTWHTADLWASGLIEQLLSINHRQWLHRNAFVH